MEGRAHPGPASLRNHNAVMGCLRAGGLGLPDAVHAYSVMDAYIYGFALQERGESEFLFGLELILDGIERFSAPATPARARTRSHPAGSPGR
jgi:hypothetical protein